MSAKEISLKPKDILFEEGDQSKNLYFLKQGVIRIFKRKAEGNIEIETIRNGQVIGELSFFDGQPRSASAEALTSCELIEMSRTALDEALTKFPEWLVSLTRTVSIRLRAANNRIRILETLSTEYETDKHGNRSREYVYINTGELLRFSTALLTVAARYGKNATAEGIEFAPLLLDKFAGQILQISSSKVVSMIETFKSVQILKGDLILIDIKFLDQLIQYLNEQNIVEPAKKQNLSEAGFRALELLVNKRSLATPIGEGSLIVTVNIAPHIKGGKILPAHFQELFDQNFIKNIVISSLDEIKVEFDSARDVFYYRTFWLLNEISKLNEQKRRG